MADRNVSCPQSHWEIEAAGKNRNPLLTLPLSEIQEKPDPTREGKRDNTVKAGRHRFHTVYDGTFNMLMHRKSTLWVKKGFGAGLRI